MQARPFPPTSRQTLIDRALKPASEHGIEERRLADRNAFGQGDHWFLALDGQTVARRRYTIYRDFDRWQERETPVVTLRFCLKGDVEAWTHDGVLHTRTGRHNLLYTPECRYRQVLRRDQANDIVEVFLTLESISALINDHPELLEGPLAPISRQEPICLHRNGLPMHPRMHSVIHQILGSSTYGSLRRLFVQAKVMELLVMQLEHNEERKVSGAGVDALSKGAVDRMIEARDRVLARMDDPPTLAELARRVGTNEFALKRDFKAVFGTTVYRLLLDHKLEHAHSLLLDTDRPIGDIARQVGYTYPAHFSTAFKKKFGVSPSTLRRT